MSFELVLPFLTPIAHFLKDDDVSEIMVNGTGRVFIERCGIIEAHDDIHLTYANLETSVKNIARVLGDEISAQKPLLDAAYPTAPGSPPSYRPAQSAASLSPSENSKTSAGPSKSWSEPAHSQRLSAIASQPRSPITKIY
jgi:Flp pilus assembly CpaF family ATPase